jgi:hypothetical protein
MMVFLAYNRPWIVIHGLYIGFWGRFTVRYSIGSIGILYEGRWDVRTSVCRRFVFGRDGQSTTAHFDYVVEKVGELIYRNVCSHTCRRVLSQDACHWCLYDVQTRVLEAKVERTHSDAIVFCQEAT